MATSPRSISRRRLVPSVPPLDTTWRRLRVGWWRFHRRPLSYAVALVVLSLGTALSMRSPTSEPTTPVLVAAVDLPAGRAITADLVRTVELPVAAVPTDALVVPDGRRLASPLVAGEVVRAGRVADGAAGPVSAALAAGAAGVTLPVEGMPPGLGVGDLLDLVDASDGSWLVRAAPVIAIDERFATIAVPGIAAGQITVAVVTGQAVPVLAPPPGATG